MLCSPECERAPLNSCSVILLLSSASKKHIGRRQIVQGFMIALRIIVLDKGTNRLRELPGKIVMLQADDIFDGAMVALDFTLSLRMIWRAASMLDAMLRQILGQIA